MTEPTRVDTTNEYAIGAGENLPNHSASLAGKGKFVRQMVPEVPMFRTRQQAYRYAAYLLELAANHLPDEEGCTEHTFAIIQEAVRSAR